MRKRLLLGTTNQAKLRLTRVAAAGLPLDVLSPADLGIALAVPEDGVSSEENAARKARAYLAVSGLACLAFDGALYIEGLPAEEQPGMYVRRFAGSGREAADAEILAHYAQLLTALGARACTWRAAAALALPGAEAICETFEFRGLMTPRRTDGVRPGAPLDSLTIHPATGRYFAHLAWEERPDCRWVAGFLSRHLARL